ncbi:hypothetical protein Golax_013559, partial [Gossypium laxum]|nr:hypothetical protein [Gossypium laxum]
MSLIGCQPKWCGGLGMRQLRDHNISFLLKLGYKVVSSDEALWKSLLKVWTLLQENLIRSVDNGNKIRCWKDSWIPSMGPLIQFILANVNINSNCLFNDLITEEGTWNLNLLQTILKQRLLTNAKRVRRGLVVDPYCPICGHELEDVMHVIRDCTTAKEGTCLVFDAKLWGILDGLKLAQQRGHEKKNTQQWILRHIFRKHNQSVDCITKLAFTNTADLHLFETPPKKALDFLVADKER